MEAEWERMKRGIALANQCNTTKAEVEAFHCSLKRGRDEAVADCRTERRIARAKKQTVDLSDASMRAAAQCTDNLPLANYDGILHLVPRLVNVVTVRLNPPTTHTHTALQCPTRSQFFRCSSPRPSPSPARGSSCRSTCTPSPRDARTRIMPRSVSQRFSWRSTTSAVAFWCFVSADQTRTRFLASSIPLPRTRLLVRRYGTTRRHRCVTNL